MIPMIYRRDVDDAASEIIERVKPYLMFIRPVVHGCIVSRGSFQDSRFRGDVLSEVAKRLVDMI